MNLFNSPTVLPGSPTTADAVPSGTSGSGLGLGTAQTNAPTTPLVQRLSNTLTLLTNLPQNLKLSLPKLQEIRGDSQQQLLPIYLLSR
ncbi:MAG: hypothetical protein HC840_26065 [Leptolyngbyaceae cyanobacterium RM2_2_4]|nr:hypothetical protein [Leptolyngbyaceae cyanobacterium RM2_2_4]